MVSFIVSGYLIIPDRPVQAPALRLQSGRIFAESTCMATARVGELEIDQNLEHEKRFWSVQRIGWILLSLLWLAGLAGVFGSGPLAGSTASGPDLRLEYDRFVRYTAPQELRLHLGPAVTAQPKVRLWVDRQYLQSQQIESVVPEPESTEAGPDRLVFVLSMAEPGAPASVTLRLQTQRIGSFEGRVGVENGGSLRFHQLVYP